MDFDKFLLIKTEFLPTERHLYLRSLYAPIIGIKSVFLYEIFSDLLVQGQNIAQSFAQICDLYSFTFEELRIAKEYLEAIGLISTFKSEDQSSYKIQLLPVKTPAEFFENKVFCQLLVEKLGQKNVDQIGSKFHIETFLDHSYKRETKSFFEIFQIKASKLNKSVDNISLQSKTYNDVYEAVEELDSLSFYKFLINKEPSSEIKKVVAKWKSLISEKIINLVFHYSYKKVNGIKQHYVDRILRDTHENGRSNFAELKNFFELILNGNSLKRDPERTATFVIQPKNSPSQIEEFTFDEPVNQIADISTLDGLIKKLENDKKMIKR
ncbi:replicative DNA helicase loader DnaB [Mycoplasma testudineum]|uniref:Replicative DNA helicase loader DnaB n=1 Tax=Mycoplasma testudineum TaxID=244584 RepID=A0A4V3C304_9MOLU|nr:hypothetical protein [Mycoplasma testudineum]OYD26783.1 hypothetical protein CG473_02405 [Mycoplasma testudineum]TDO19919.1 replicative DNA helicase loader DnaB [Mycoplasma testudineum]